MAKAELKTKKTEASVEDFLSAIEDENKRKDAKKISAMMEKAAGEKPKMWGAAIVGFGTYIYKYATGREGEWMKVGFSPRKQNLTLYLNSGGGWNEDLLSKLGKHKLGMGCLYINRLSDIDENILQKLIEESVENKEK